MARRQAPALRPNTPTPWKDCTATMRDPYSVLGVSRNATETDIKRAFRTLAKEHHPDQNAGDAKAKEKFAEINTAYEILGDAEKRKRYDRGEIGPDGKERFAGFDPGAGGFKGFGTDSFQYRSGSQRAGAFEDILKDIFGTSTGGPGGPGAARPGGGRQARPAPGSDISATLALTLEDLVSETKPTVTLPTGKRLQITIPGGVEDGQQIRLKGQGQPGTHGGPPGDALVTISLQVHRLYRRDGADLRLDLPISLDEAVLGAKVRVPTLDGAVGLTIPPGTTGRGALRVRGRGLPAKTGQRGDLFVTPRIVLPDDASEELETLANALRARQTQSVRGEEFEN